MKTLLKSTRENVYHAPIIPWNNGTYTPISNKSIMDLMDEKLRELDLRIKSEEYHVTTSNEGLVKGVIGKYYISSADGEFGQQVLFRNSYDKSMSFCFAEGLLVWCCTNGCVSGDYTYKRVHKGTFDDDNSSSTWYDIMDNINTGFSHLQESYETTIFQMNQLKKFEISPTDVYNILGELFFDKQIVSITQMSIIKRELEKSVNFRHLGDKDFSAYDLYNHVTESLKSSHPTTYISDHTGLHRLFEEKFGV